MILGFYPNIIMMPGSKGDIRIAPRSRNPPTFRTFVELSLHFVLHVGRVNKPCLHRQAILPCRRAFDPDLIISLKRGEIWAL